MHSERLEIDFEWLRIDSRCKFFHFEPFELNLESLVLNFERLFLNFQGSCFSFDRGEIDFE